MTYSYSLLFLKSELQSQLQDTGTVIAYNGPVVGRMLVSENQDVVCHQANLG